MTLFLSRRTLCLYAMLAGGAPCVHAQTLYVPNGTSGIGNNTFNSNVGVGTNTPGYKLDVNSTSSRVARNSYDGITFEQLAYPNQGSLLFSSDRTGYVFSIGNKRVSDGDVLPIITMYDFGKVGIGTTDPGSLLTLSRGSEAASAQLELRNVGGITDGKFDGIRFTQGSSGAVPLGSFRALYRNNGSPDLAFFTRSGPYSESEKVRILNSGNVGIGTPGPVQLLHIYGTSNPTLLVEGGPNTNPAVTLRTQGAYGTFNIVDGNGSYLWSVGREPGDVFTIRDANGPRLVINNGNVGIGTTNPTQKLSVNGTIRAKEVIVEASPWPDFVFSPEYELPTLDAVKAHIAENGHLPGVPSAAAVTEQGVSVGEMQSTLLRKIEELTLYLIAQEKRNEEQDARIEQLERENAALRRK